MDNFGSDIQLSANESLRRFFCRFLPFHHVPDVQHAGQMCGTSDASQLRQNTTDNFFSLIYRRVWEFGQVRWSAPQPRNTSLHLCIRIFWEAPSRYILQLSTVGSFVGTASVAERSRTGSTGPTFLEEWPAN